MTGLKLPKLRNQTLKRIWRFGARLDVAATLIFIVLLAAVLGSWFPQWSPLVAADAERLRQWQAGIRAKYGGLTDLLIAGKAFRWFSSPIFVVSSGLLTVATLVCTLERWRGLWRQVFRHPVRCSDAAFDRAPHTARLNVPAAIIEPQAVRECLERRGFRVHTTEDVTTDSSSIYLRGDRNRLAPLATLVTHLAALLLLLGALLSSGYGWREEVTVGPGETVQVGHGSGLSLRNDGFMIERYRDGSAAGYQADVTVLAGDREVVHSRTQVNRPLVHSGIGFHLQGYQGTEGDYTVTVLVVHDPGYGLVIGAGLLLLLGLTVSFNFPHCWVRARVESEGTLRLAGWAGRQAYDFGQEFASLIEELKQTMERQ